MNIGDRIRWFRNRIGLTQKQLGMRVGFPDRNADIRIAQYEVGTRKPKADLTAAFAKALGVSPLALSIPDINNPLALIHMLFALEDCYGTWIEQGNGTFQICADPYNNQQAAQLYEMLGEWCNQHEKHLSGAITKQEYDSWRYNYTGGEK